MNRFDAQDERLSAYLDGALSPDEARQVEQALADDPQARAQLDGLRRTATALRGLPRGRAPAGLTDAVRERLERKTLLDEAPLRFPARRAWWQTVAYAAMLLLTVSIGYLSMRPPAASVGPIAQAEKLADVRRAPKLERNAPAQTTGGLANGGGSAVQSAAPPVTPAPANTTLNALGYLAGGTSGSTAPPPPASAPSTPTALAAAKQTAAPSMPETETAMDERTDAASSLLLMLNASDPSDVDRMANEVRSQAGSLKLAEESRRENAPVSMLEPAPASSAASPGNAPGNLIVLSGSPEQIAQLVSNLRTSPVTASAPVQLTGPGMVGRNWNDSAMLANNWRPNNKAQYEFAAQLQRENAPARAQAPAQNDLKKERQAAPDGEHAFGQPAPPREAESAKDAPQLHDQAQPLRVAGMPPSSQQAGLQKKRAVITQANKVAPPPLTSLLIVLIQSEPAPAASRAAP